MIIKATVKSVKLVYLATSLDAEVARLTPFYVVTGELEGKDGRVGNLLQAVPAVP